MSMLSAQCERLRKVADDLDFYTITRDIHAASMLMREAADTIDELRMHCQELQEQTWRTCENVAPDYLDYLCSECGFVHYHSDENDSGDGNKWSYCPNCGRRVVE